MKFLLFSFKIIQRRFPEQIANDLSALLSTTKVSQIMSSNLLKVMPADQIKAGMQISFMKKPLHEDFNELNLRIKLVAFTKPSGC